MEEAIPGGMDIGQIHTMVTNGNLDIGGKDQEATIGNPGGGASAVSCMNRFRYRSFTKNFFKVFLVENL